MRRVLTFTHGVDHPSTRLRLAAFQEPLLKSGWDLRLHHMLPGMGGRPPAGEPWARRLGRRLGRAWRSLRAALALRRLAPGEPVLVSREVPLSQRPFLTTRNPLVVDLDDALYLGSGREKVLALCRRARVVVCGNATLAADLADVARERVVIPTVVDTARCQVRSSHRLDGPLRVGWLGTSMSLEHTLEPALPALERAQRGLGFELVVVSDQPPPFLQGRPWARWTAWSPLVEARISALFDVGLMPLQETPFQAAKCGAKLLQYLAAGLPAVATPLGVNREVVLDGVTGLWARSEDEWAPALERLTRDEALRSRLGRAGRDHVVERYSLARWAPAWVAVLEGLAGPAD